MNISTLIILMKREYKKMTPLEKMIEARKRLILDYPFWGTLALKLKLVEDFTCSRGWTNGKVLAFNPRWVDTLSMSQTIAFNAHEIGHPMLKHHLRREGRKYRQWQFCCDLALNPIIMEAGFELPGKPAFEERFKGMSVEEIYKIREEEELAEELEKKKGEQYEDKSESGDSSNGAGNEDESEDQNEKESEDKFEDKSKDEENQDSEGEGQESRDKEEDDEGKDHSGDSKAEQKEGEDEGENIKTPESNTQIDPSDCGEVRDFPGELSTPSKSEKNIEETDWNITTLQATEVAKKCGEGPGGMERIIDEIIHPKLDPREVFQQFIAQHAKDDYNWIRPNRRYISQNLYLPALKSDELLNIIFALDTSGSITKEELNTMTGWLEMVLEIYPAEINVVYADYIIQGNEIFTRDDLPLKLSPKGFGGTDFKPVFEWVEEERLQPTCLVYMTDLCCWSYPKKEPGYPVLWIHVDNGNFNHSVPPFGDVVVMEME